MKEIKPYDTKALLETSIDLSKARDFDSIAEILFDFVEDIIPINMSVLYVLEPDGQSLKPLACRGAKLDNLRKRSIFRLGEGGVGYVGREKKALLLTDVQKSTSLPIHIRQVDGEDPYIRSFLAVPLIVNNRLTGVLSASSSRPNRYTMHDVEIVSIVANQVAALVELYGRMEETQRFSDLILENMNSGVLVTDTTGKVIMMNRTGELITGSLHRQVRGKSILRLAFLEAETRKKIKNCLLGTEQLLETSGIVLARRSKEKKYIKMSSSRLFAGSEMEKGHIIIFRDVTNVEYLQQRLSRYEKLTALGKWTSSISHEIRNSLLPIRTSIGLLKNKLAAAAPSESVGELLNVLEEESERLNRFLNQLTDGNRNSFNRNLKTPLFPALEETVSLVYSKIRERNIRLQIPKPTPCYLPFSKDQIKEMFLNLFLNSVDALDEAAAGSEKYIRIEVRQDGDSTVIDFIDNGAGVKKENLNNLFEPFFTTKTKGTGLGLYNIQTLVSSVGGKVQMESVIGKETVVSLSLKSGGERQCQ